MPKTIIIAIAAGLVSSLLSSAATIGSGLGLLLAYFSMIPLLLIGLSQGRKAATFATLVGMLSAITLSNIYQGTLYSISIAFPAWLIVLTALHPKIEHRISVTFFPIGTIISRLAVLGGIFLLLGTIIFFDQPGDLAQDVEALLLKMIANNHPSLNAGTNHRFLIERMVPLFPAIIFLSWLLMTIINTLVAQAILIKAGMNLKPAFQYSKINAPDWLYWAFVISGIFLLIGPSDFEYLSRNLTVIFLIPFLFIGLSVIHIIARTFPSPSIILIPLYFLIIISSWPTFVAIIIGFFEKWTKLRRKFKLNRPKDDSALG